MMRSGLGVGGEEEEGLSGVIGARVDVLYASRHYRDCPAYARIGR